MGELGERGKVSHIGRRVGDCLRPDQARALGHGRGHGGWIGQRQEPCDDPEAREEAGEKRVGAPVHGTTREHLVSRTEGRRQRGMDRGHSRTPDQRGLAAFQLGERGLQ